VHPVLFEIPLPAWTLPLGPALVGLAFVGLAVAWLGFRARAWDLVALGAGAGVAALLGAARFRGETIALGPMPLYGFGVFLSGALIAGWVLAQRLAEREGLSRDVIARCYFATAVSGLIGARVLYVLTNLRDFHSLADMLAFRSGGLVFYGGVLGGFVGSLVSLRRTRMPWLAWADIAAPCLVTGSMLGRMGCYLAGCDYGVPLGGGAPRFLVRLGTFPRWPDNVAGPVAGSPAWVDHVLYRGLPLDSTASLPVHPTQLYESIAAGALLAALLALRERRRFRGEVFLAFVAGYGAVRFLLETVRDDPERGLYGPAAAPAVLWSVGLLVLGIAFIAGPSRAITSGPARGVSRAVAVLAAVGFYAVLRSGHRTETALSTSQWLAMATSIAAAVAWRFFDGARKSGPSAPGFTGGTVSS
jgi:phosphatidylglycerol---prolipoprotein diacylglyceryl transferase